MARYSRLAQNEQKRAIKSTFLYLVLSISLILVLVFFGVPLISRITGFVVNITGKESETPTKTNTFISPPRLSPLPEFTKEEKIRISGIASPGNNIEIFINNEKKEVLTDKEGEWSSSVNLKEGANTLWAVAVGEQGGRSKESAHLTINYDKTPPQVEIITPANESKFFGGRQQSQRIQGQTESEAKAYINDRIVIVAGDGKFDHFISLSDGENIFKIKVLDQAGNETETELKLFFTP